MCHKKKGGYRHLVTGNHHAYLHHVRRYCLAVLTSRRILEWTSNPSTGCANETEPVGGRLNG